MKVQNSLLLIVVILFTTSCQEASTIFQQDGEGWFIGGDAEWAFDNDELIGTVTDGAGFVMTEKTYKNFELELEFYPSDSVNSGVFVRCEGHAITATECYEINIWDSRPDPEYRTGAVVLKSAPKVYIETTGKWNAYKIKCQDDHIEVWLNGTLTADFKDNQIVEGYIGLQASGTGEIKFRNVRIKHL
ncbi:MAG: DUF1080 domain-containing protein [Cyclobacteriaceae bacterium]